MYELMKEEEKRNKPVQDKLREELQMQLDRNKNRPVLKVQ